MPRFNRLILVLVCALLALPSVVSAQNAGAELVGRAVLSAESLNDGPPAGTALSTGAVINGVNVPFDSQPVGAISAILPGEYPGTWLAITSGQFNSSQNSADFELRVYVFEFEFRRASGGSGQVSLLDRRILSDSGGRIEKNIVNSSTRTRYLTGADFSPRSVQRAGDAYWVADESTPALLRFDTYGKLLEAPIPLSGGALQGMSVMPDGSALIIAQRGRGRTVTFSAFNLTTRQFETLGGAYTLDRDNYTVGGIAMINANEVVVLEIDSGENRRAAFKRVYLFNVREGKNKTQLADLLNVSDPSGISTSGAFDQPKDAFGLGSTFKYPYRQISAVFPVDEQTLVIANNNNVPFGLGRSTSTADPTDYILIRLNQSLNLDPAFLRPIR
ncbi:MAG: esterase-like activity of phytase family protein [Anaerolinea sp.]|nr:esterase-like activity of phytase family protein [Anaerolinea sp.]MCC6975276.1 esterase-like activity of phytase family protein [Anaerolineae bacterium]CAG1004806.1 hypothetical protein ANRL4_03477 [Anaerolineae bacterium]